MRVRIKPAVADSFLPAGWEGEVLQSTDRAYLLEAPSRRPLWFWKEYFEVVDESSVAADDKLVKDPYSLLHEMYVAVTGGKKRRDSVSAARGSVRAQLGMRYGVPSTAYPDPSARRDVEHVAVALPDPTPFNHFPDLAGWTVDSWTRVEGGGEWRVLTLQCGCVGVGRVETLPGSEE